MHRLSSDFRAATRVVSEPLPAPNAIPPGHVLVRRAYAGVAALCKPSLGHLVLTGPINSNVASTFMTSHQQTSRLLLFNVPGHTLPWLCNYRTLTSSHLVGGT